MKKDLDFRYFFPEVLQAVPTEDYKVYAYFNDGTIHLTDVRPLIQPGTVFEPLGNLDIFKNALTVLNGTVAWDLTGNYDKTRCIDLDPMLIWQTPEVPDPLPQPEEDRISAVT